MKFPWFVPDDLRDILRRHLPPQPEGFEVQELSCGHCQDRDRLKLTPMKKNHAQVRQWLDKHQGCEERAQVEKFVRQAPRIAF